MQENLKIPEHIAIILDGNGRWAKQRHLPRSFGHEAGAKTVENICKEANDLGIKYLTMYAFSTENWKRPQDEVSKLMSLLVRLAKSLEKKIMKENMRILSIGDRKGLPEKVREAIERLETVTKNNTGLTLILAINYGGRDEIVRGMKRVLKDFKEGKITEEDITEENFSNYLDTKGVPEPDLLIRTSGEERLSNYLLWQLAYTEFYFTDIHWPDFNKEELLKAIEKYNSRDRRYGGVK